MNKVSPVIDTLPSVPSTSLMEEKPKEMMARIGRQGGLEANQDKEYKTKHYSPEGYELEKASGTRQENGASKLGKLKPWHIQAVKLHLDGHANKEIALALQKTESVISLTLRDPQCQELIVNALESYKGEFEALEGKAIDAIRTGLNSEDTDTKLKSASVYYKEKGRIESVKGDKHQESAEDIVTKLFESIEGETVNVQVNINPQRDDTNSVVGSK